MKTMFVIIQDGEPIAVARIEWDAQQKIREIYDRDRAYYVEVPVVPVEQIDAPIIAEGVPS